MNWLKAVEFLCDKRFLIKNGPMCVRIIDLKNGVREGASSGCIILSCKKGILVLTCGHVIKLYHQAKKGENITFEVYFDGSDSTPFPAMVASSPYAAYQEVGLLFVPFKTPRRVAPLSFFPQETSSPLKMASFSDGIASLCITDAKVCRPCISGKDAGRPHIRSLMQYDVLSCPGSSGSPMFEPDGGVVAVHCFNVEGFRSGVTSMHIRNILVGEYPELHHCGLPWDSFLSDYLDTFLLEGHSTRPDPTTPPSSTDAQPLAGSVSCRDASSSSAPPPPVAATRSGHHNPSTRSRKRKSAGKAESLSLKALKNLKLLPHMQMKMTDLISEEAIPSQLQQVQQTYPSVSATTSPAACSMYITSTKDNTAEHPDDMKCVGKAGSQSLQLMKTIELLPHLQMKKLGQGGNQVMSCRGLKETTAAASVTSTSADAPGVLTTATPDPTSVGEQLKQYSIGRSAIPC